MNDFVEIYIETIDEIKELDFEKSIKDIILDCLDPHGVEKKLPLRETIDDPFKISLVKLIEKYSD